MAIKTFEDYYPDHNDREALARQVAALCSAGVSMKVISEKMNLDTKRVQAIYDSIECKFFIRQIGKEAVKGAVMALKKEISKLTPLIVGAIEFHLKEKNLQAIPHALNILGVMNRDEVENAQEQKITVVLPAAHASGEIKIENISDGTQTEIVQKKPDIVLSRNQERLNAWKQNFEEEVAKREKGDPLEDVGEDDAVEDKTD